MKNLFTTILVSTAASFSPAVYAADESAESESKVEYKDTGGYESTRSTERVTPSGSKVTTEKTVDVDVDSDGLTERTIKTETTADPKGLMNKKQDNSETEIEEKERGGYKQVTTRKDTDANGTNIIYRTSVCSIYIIV